jgi:hypothetical protein
MIVAAPGWTGFAIPASTGQILNMAYDRWVRGLPSPEPLVSQRLLLGVMTGHVDADLEDEPARMSTWLKAAYIAVMRCDPNATAALRMATPTDRRQATYWALAIRLARLEGTSASDYQRLYRIMTSDLLLTDREVGALNPLDVNGTRGSSPDLWGYRRQPINWPDTTWVLPSPSAGFARWHTDPVGALRESGVSGVLDDCPRA